MKLYLLVLLLWSHALYGFGTSRTEITKPVVVVKKDITPESISECLYRVHNRGKIPFAFAKEVIEHIKSEPDSVFAANPKIDIYSNTSAELGGSNRKAWMANVLIVLAGYESSWRWGEGRDVTNPKGYTCTGGEAGAWQTSANSMYFTGKEYMKSVCGGTDCELFQTCSKSKHAFAIGQVIRVLRNTVNHHGPVKRKEINKWLSRSCVKQIEGIL